MPRLIWVFAGSPGQFVGFVVLRLLWRHIGSINKVSVWIRNQSNKLHTKHACVKIIWTASSEFGTYHLCEQRRFRRDCASAQSRQNLRCSLIQAVSQEEPSDRKLDPWPLWMAGHAQLKLVMTECSKTQIRLTGLISVACLMIYSHGTTRILISTIYFHLFCFCALPHPSPSSPPGLGANDRLPGASEFAIRLKSGKSKKKKSEEHSWCNCSIYMLTSKQTIFLILKESFFFYAS